MEKDKDPLKGHWVHVSPDLHLLSIVHPAIISPNRSTLGKCLLMDLSYFTVLTPVGLLRAAISLLPLPISIPSSTLSLLFYLEDGGNILL
jgi:hypothetical protein